MNNLDSDNFVVYPNPANTFVQVKLQNNSENIDSISLTDLLGNTINLIWFYDRFEFELLLCITWNC